jgi:hypothetical protein
LWAFPAFAHDQATEPVTSRRSGGMSAQRQTASKPAAWLNSAQPQKKPSDER